MTETSALARTLLYGRSAVAGLERTLQRDFGWAGAIASMLILGLFAALLLAPGTFSVGTMLNDVLTAIEAAYRVAHGQVPGRDFTSAIGVLAYLPNALAYRWGGDLVHGLAIGFAVFGALVTVLGLYVAWTRLTLLSGILLVATAGLPAMAPWIIGTPVTVRGVTLTTAAMFYNRIGFALVLLAAMLPIAPRPGRERLATRLDVAWVVVAFMLAFYVKMPFGLAVLALAAYWAVLIGGERRLLIHLAIGIGAAMLAMEIIFPGLHAGYLAEMQLASKASEGVLYPADLASLAIKTLPEVVTAAALPLALLAARGGLTWAQAGYFICLWGGSLLLLSQSAQGSVLVTPLAAGAFAVAALSRLPQQREAQWLAAVLLACGALALIVPSASAIARHALQGARQPAIAGLPPMYRSLRVADDGADPAALDKAMTGQLSAPATFTAARARAPLATANDLPEREYAATLAHLPAARALCATMRDRTAVLDYANASASLFGHPPAGRWANLHWERSFSRTSYVRPEQLFEGVGCLLEPKLPQSTATVEGIRLVYGVYIDARFPVVGETPYWRVRVLRPGG